MKKQVVALVALAGFLTFAGGCAKQETVKKEEPIAPSATAAKAPAPQAPAPSANAGQDNSRVKPETVQPDAAAAGQAAKADQAAKAAAGDAAQAAELKAGLEKVYFDFDSASLSKEARVRLGKDAELIRKDSGAKVQIQGNCDERGSDDYNLALGEKRAQAAKKYLTSLGVPADRLSVISYGKEKPADAGHDEAAWAKNRRDELVVR
ncbi:peptidoglycan-associated lipoprotein Pal [Geomonas sp. Red32]|uniref:peptidoglycan-associated lipoprotein Pal n=1 Tax=Geomonas sp. Red32 TaxID=2912856 RepID=UPI00202D0CE0|nr:peptidoglycan-associated lipoprotein Pal [Geomonas sp. Red32]MCM0082839.1 peptidoglycan-associated lipoprotein Pal [Geomonas sp. Red32]